MKKIIRLNEADLARIVRRVINERGPDYLNSLTTDRLGSPEQKFNNNKLMNDLKKDTWSSKIQDDLDKNMTSYKIKQGDTLSGIASKFGKTLDQLIKLNPGLDDPNKIFTGQMIKVK